MTIVRRSGRKTPPPPRDKEASTVVASRVPLYVKEALDRYVAEFNRQNIGGGMSPARLMGAVITKFLRDSGALDEG